MKNALELLRLAADTKIYMNFDDMTKVIIEYINGKLLYNAKTYGTSGFDMELTPNNLEKIIKSSTLKSVNSRHIDNSKLETYYIQLGYNINIQNIKIRIFA